ncbi:MAG: threonine/serine dehydratase [Bacteroidetes bacterium]|nr:MAG: threonine/serine dehydratase [Bacteroidota bacterium]
MNILAEILHAAIRIEPHILKTPLIHSAFLSQLSGGEVYLKLESEQYTGSFKARGAMNKIQWLVEQQNTRGIITASTGNHGMGVARALGIAGLKGRVVVPENVVPAKYEALRAFGATVQKTGADCFVSENYAIETAQKEDLVYISPYNDPQIIGGQGTIGIEIGHQLGRPPDNVFVTVGGGGLVSGVGTYLKTLSPQTRIFGCQPENSPEMALSVRANDYVTVEPKDTLSDGSAGAFERESITFPICQKVVDEFILVSEKDIARAIDRILTTERKLIEGAAGVAVAAFLNNKARFRGQTTVILICGGNISKEKLQKALALAGQ